MRIDRTRLLAGLTLAVMTGAGAATAARAAYAVDKDHSRIGFVAFTNLFDVEGRFRRFEAKANIDPKNLPASALQFIVDVGSLDTDIEKRNKHLRSNDFFAVKLYPEATFVSTMITAADADNLRVAGDLTIKGKTHAVEIPVRLSSMDNAGTPVLRGKGRVTVKRADFDLNYQPGGVLPRIDDNVDIVFDIDLQPAERK